MKIYDLLKKDHQELMGLLDELIKLDRDDDYVSVVTEQIKNHLIPHARAEESVLYNSIRAVSPDNSFIMHSYKEHMEAETLLRGLQVKDKMEVVDWKNSAIKLKEALQHHIQEEENKVFMEAQKIFSDQEAEMMGLAFTELKTKVAQQGFMKNSFDFVINLMPPRFVDKMKNLGTPQNQ